MCDLHEPHDILLLFMVKISWRIDSEQVHAVLDLSFCGEL